MRAPLLLLCGLSCGAVWADPGLDAARALFERRIEPAAAAAAWDKARLSPDEACALLGQLLPYAEGPATDHQVTLEDAHGGKSETWVALPPAGPAADGRYGALVVLHGLGGDGQQALALGRPLAPPHAIVIAPTAQKPREGLVYEDLRTASLAGIPLMKRFPHWWSYREDAFPLLALDYLQRHYRIDPDRVLLVGYSMGGFGSWNLGLRFHERFAALAPLAGGIAREEYLLGRDVLSRRLLDNAAMVPCFFIHGSDDEVVPVRFDRWTAEDLTARGVPFRYEEVAGGKHRLNELSDGGELRTALTAWLAERVRDPHPRRVVHHAIGGYHAGAYWLRLDGLRDPVRVLAEDQGKNRVRLELEGEGAPAGVTLYLDPSRFDPKKPLTVALGERVLFRGKVPASLLTVAETFARSHDPTLTFARGVSVGLPSAKGR